MTERASGPRPSERVSAPPDVEAVFGPFTAAACRYAELLSGAGVERGVIGPREPARVWDRHLFPSALLGELVPPGCAVVDLGSGAGLPGIPLALARPDLAVSLLEPLARRVAFLQLCLAELWPIGSTNVQISHGRAQQAPPGCADVVVARAVAPLSRLIPWALPLLRPAGLLLAIKGEQSAADLTTARNAASSVGWTASTVELSSGGRRVRVVTVRVASSTPVTRPPGGRR